MGDTAVVGRDKELGRCLDAAARPGCIGVVLVGPAGVGKTALAVTLASRLCDDGPELVRIAATRSASKIPLGAVAPLLTLPTAPTAHADLIRHTVAALSARANERGLVVLVDDAHLLDDASATLVHQLALAGAAFLIVTVRAQEAVADPITALWKDGLADRLDIGVLGLSESTTVAAAILGNPVHPTTATTLFEASGGNPLFLQQLVASARESGALALVAGRGPVAGRWRLIGPLPLPVDLVSAVEERLEHLGEEDRSIIELLALGEPLGASLLEELAGPGGDERLERLEADTFIVAESDRRRLNVRLAHPMYGEVLRATMPITWANRARILLAGAVMERGLGRRDDAMRVAMWRLDAGVSIPYDVADVAARQALVRFDAPLAERIVRQSDGYRAHSATTGGSVIGTAPRANPSALGDSGDADSEMLLAMIATFSGRSDSAIDHLDQVDRLLDSSSHDGRLRSAAAVLRFDVLSYKKGHFEEAFGLEVPADGDPSVGTQLTSRKAIVAVTLAQPQLAESLMSALPAVAPGTHAEVWVSIAKAMTAAARGRLHEATEAIDTARLTFNLLGWDPSLPDPVMPDYIRIRLLQNEGLLVEASRLADQATDYARDRTSEQALAWILSAASSVQRFQGRAVQAAASASASAEIFDRTGSAQLAAVALAELAAAAATAGDAGAAAAAAQRCEEIGIMNFYGRSAAAWAAIAAGRITDGIGQLLALLSSRTGREAREELLLVLDIIRLGGANEIVDAATHLASVTDGDFAGLVAEYARASANDDGPALEVIVEQLAACGFTLPAAEAAIAACAAHLHAGKPRLAKAFAGRADDLVGLLDGVCSPGLHPAHVQAALAPREREVAALAATGATSRAIADDLGLSQRTVESYLQNAYDKLGLANRAELATTLCGRPP